MGGTSLGPIGSGSRPACGTCSGGSGTVIVSAPFGDRCMLGSFPSLPVNFGCAGVGFGCAGVGFGCAGVGFGCAGVGFGGAGVGFGGAGVGFGGAGVGFGCALFGCCCVLGRRTGAIRGSRRLLLQRGSGLGL
ncbi:MAG: hypothetical protein M0013_07310, partial [Actinomycetota bacterium]|nr:hypothetical protein [Actinomycetota bacterium]